MHNTKVLMVVLALVALPMAGCIENMDDLKDKIQGAQTGDPIEQQTTNTTDGDLDLEGNVTDNSTTEYKPPVARITVFAEGGALAYRASFVAENQTEPIIVQGGTFTFVAADSEAVDPRAELTTFEWDINGEAKEGRKTEATITEPGVYMIVLKVTDSKGSVDDQMIHLGIVPEPFTETFEMSGGPVLGLEEAGAHAAVGTNPFTVLAEKDGKTLKAQSLSVRIASARPSDLILKVTDPSGTETQDDDLPGTLESISIDSPAAGEWVAEVRAYAGGTDTYTLEVSITYVQVVEGLGGDGHAHAH